MNKIKSEDFVLHKPSGEEWVVCGINYERGELIPCGYPFGYAKIEDCVLIESRNLPQPESYKNHLLQHGCESFIEK
jgi:hypothetical protein